jgi:hypothetical protein
VAGALRFGEAPERWLLGYGGRQKNLNRRAIEEILLRLTIGLPLESEAEATWGLPQGGPPATKAVAPVPDQHCNQRSVVDDATGREYLGAAIEASVIRVDRNRSGIPSTEKRALSCCPPDSGTGDRAAESATTLSARAP